MRTLVTFLVVLLSTANMAHADLSPAAIRKLSRTPGVVKKTSGEGGARVTTWEKNGVTITREKNGAIVMNDASGKGAVICSRSIYIAFKTAVDVCSSGDDQAIRDELDTDIRRIDKFIVRNSLEKVSLAHLRRDEAKQLAEESNAAAPESSDLRASLCRSDGSAGKYVAYIKGQSSAQRKEALDRLLSVPRWPVINPCM